MARPTTLIVAAAALLAACAPSDPDGGPTGDAATAGAPGAEASTPAAPAASDPQAAGAAPTEQTTRRVPQLDNEHVEVWRSIILPNQPLNLHRHDHPRVIVALRGGTLRVFDESGAHVRDMTWETGGSYWLDADPPGTLHGDSNEGPEPVEVVVVQLKGIGGG